MNLFVCNIGSTSFKFRLFAMEAGREEELVRGAVQSVGATRARCTIGPAGGDADEDRLPIADQAAAIEHCLQRLEALEGPPERRRIDAVAFKAVHGGDLPAAVRVTDDVLAVMERFAPAAPAHNPAYVAAMRFFATRRPELPLVACFETGLHVTIPDSRRLYAIPHDWSVSFGIRRWGFHGASHRYVARRTASLLDREGLRVVSCHLGGSSSVCALRGATSVACSFGMTPQSGLPQNDRVGDLDPYVLPILRQHTGMSCEELLDHLARAGGLAGISALSGEMPVLLDAAAEGHEGARRAIAVYVESIRHYLGAFVVALGGLDALVFTGGIGSRSAEIRRRVCADLAFLGVHLDETRNGDARPDVTLSPDGERIAVLVLETNEELIVARQAHDCLQATSPEARPPGESESSA